MRLGQLQLVNCNVILRPPAWCDTHILSHLMAVKGMYAYETRQGQTAVCEQTTNWMLLLASGYMCM